MAALEVIALDTATPQLRAPGTGDTYSAPRALAITPETLTGAAATSGLSITQTWNTTGTPTALKLDVTDTASNAASLLMDLRVGGSSVASISKAGMGRFRPGNYGNPAITFNGATDGSGIYAALSGLGVSSYNFQTVGGSVSTVITTAGVVATGTTLGLCAGGASVADTILARDAANTLALRNSTNAQTFNTYGTYTDASNYRRAALAMTTAGVATLKPEGAGTGASGNVLHISGLPTSNPGPGILWNNAGTPAIGT